MRTLVALAIAASALMVGFSHVGTAGAGNSDMFDTYGRSRVAPVAPRTVVDGCKTVALPAAFTDAGTATNVLQPDAGVYAIVPGGEDAGAGNILYDGGQTATCVTLEKDQEYAIRSRLGTTGCLSLTGKLFGPAGRACDGHKPIDGPEAIRFGPAPDGGAPCIWAVSNSATADKLDICPRVP